MQVFVTGASGYIGTAVVKELLSEGHKVRGLVRSDSGAKNLKALGADVLHGDLKDVEALRQAASESDGVIHLGFIHDFTDFVGSCATDRAAITALGSGLVAAGGNRPLVMTSGTLMLEKGGVRTEDDEPDIRDPFGSIRAASQPVALDFVNQGLDVSVVRLPPIVHGDAGLGLIAVLLGGIKQQGSIAYVGAGDNKWCSVHYLDAAHAFCLALEKAKGASIFHPVDEKGVSLKDITEAVGKQFGVPVLSKTVEEVQAYYGPMAGPVAADNQCSSIKTREQLGWAPSHVGLLEDIMSEGYFGKYMQ
jgi:nucleoside-diphosphate-sugar epimerase